MRYQLRPLQAEAHENIRAELDFYEKRLVVQAPCGFGKCLAPGTLVIMGDGSAKAVERLRVGDHIASPTGMPNEIISLGGGRSQMWRIRQNWGEDYVVNNDHILSLMRTSAGSGAILPGGQKANRGELGPFNVTVSDIVESKLSVVGSLRGWCPSAPVSFSPSTSGLPVPPYVFGAWLADGSTKGCDLSKPPCNMVDEWISWGVSLGCDVRNIASGGRCPTWRLSTPAGYSNLALDAIRLALGGKNYKHIPDAYMGASVEDRMNLLAGYLDGDGHYANGNFEYSSVSEKLARGIASVARSLGFRVSIKLRRKGIKSTGFSGEYWVASILGDVSAIPTKDKKAPRAKSRIRHNVWKISIEDAGFGEYFGFTIGGDGLFLLGDYTVTHNTLLAAKMIQENLDAGKRSIFTAPALSLIDQTVEKFYEYGISDIGVLQANHPLTAPQRKVQVCSVQTLMRRPIPMADEVFIDECQNQFDFVYDWMQKPEWQDVPFIGLTATPWARGMGKHWTKLIVAARLGDMVEQGWLKPLRYYAPIEIDTTGVKIVAGDYHEGQLSDASRKTTILADTVKQWLEHAKYRPTIAFCVDRAHAQDMQARFMEVGVPCEYIDANTDAGERQAIGRRMESGQSKVCVSVGCLIAGLDWTFVNCVLFARKTKSKILWVQGIGRGMRNHPGQEDCLLLDCAGNQSLGHPYDIHYEDLDDGTVAARAKREEKDKKTAEPKKCGKCGAMRQPKLRACPVCGHIPTPPPSVSELDARLKEVQRNGIPLPTREKARKDLMKHDDMQEWYSSLLAIRDQRGYADGWASVQFKERFGDWPNKVGMHDAALDAPAPEVSSWVTHRMIKFAKSKRR